MLLVLAVVIVVQGNGTKKKVQFVDPISEDHRVFEQNTAFEYYPDSENHQASKNHPYTSGNNGKTTINKFPEIDSGFYDYPKQPKKESKIKKFFKPLLNRFPSLKRWF